jgi:hypothetical protein
VAAIESQSTSQLAPGVLLAPRERDVGLVVLPFVTLDAALDRIATGLFVVVAMSLCA